jgi:hypothetical protein
MSLTFALSDEPLCAEHNADVSRQTWGGLAMPLALTDDAMQAVLDASAPLPRGQRGEFLEAMAAELTAHPVASPGELRRVIIEMQRRYWSPPQLGDEGVRSKYR